MSSKSKKALKAQKEQQDLVGPLGISPVADKEPIIEFRGVTKTFELYKNSRRRLLGTLLKKNQDIDTMYQVKERGFSLKRW